MWCHWRTRKVDFMDILKLNFANGKEMQPDKHLVLLLVLYSERESGNAPLRFKFSLKNSGLTNHRVTIDTDELFLKSFRCQMEMAWNLEDKACKTTGGRGGRERKLFQRKQSCSLPSLHPGYC